MRISDWSSDVCSSDLMKTPSLFFLRLPILAMKYLHKFRAMPLFRKSKRRCRLDHYLIAAPSNPVYRIVFLTKFRSSLVSRSNKQVRGSAASEDLPARREIGRASCRERVCQYV